MYDYDDPKAPLKARIDIKQAKMVNDVSLDDVVTVTIKGKVKRLDGVEQYKGTDYLGKGKTKEVNKIRPGTLEIEIASITVLGEGFGADLDED